MSHLNPGLISAYNSLTDKHLAGYFSNTRIRRHLQRAGLITRSGRIVPDKEYRHKLIQRAHQRHVRECLAQAIFHKVLEMERLHQIEIKRKLEEFARRERVHKIKVERSKRYEEDIIRILSPRPPTGVRGFQKQHSGPEGEHSESSESPGSSRPNTAPGKMQRPVRLKPIHSNSTTATVRRSSPYRLLESSHGNEQPFNCTMDKESRRRLTPMEASHGISPYCLPVINNFVAPAPPATKRKDRGVKLTRSSTVRGRRLRPTTASSGADISEDPPMLRSSVHQSKVTVNMVYFGKTVHLSPDLTDMRDDVKVFQQHCGGENLCVFKGKLREGELFQFISRRHRGFPFSLTFFLNGLQVERLSSCCEFKHRKGSRLGGRHGHFGFSGVEGASPCYKCIIAMGLDKKPTPPPKRVKENAGRDQSASSTKDSPEVETERMVEDAVTHSDCESSQPRDMETQVEEETAREVEKVRDDYEEDFEADDEGPAENEDAGEKKSPPLLSETERQLRDKDVTETDYDEKDEDIKSRCGSSSVGSDQEESDNEAANNPKEEEKAEQPEEVNQEESVSVSNEKEEPNLEEVVATKGESPVVKDSDMQTSAGESTEIEISDTSALSGNEKRQSDDISGDTNAEKTAEESKQEEEQERAKSVQEKLAEAILKESQCNSEPELSDTSTEESTDEGSKQDSKDTITEKLHTLTEHQQTTVGEVKREESVSGDGEASQKQEEETHSKEQEEGEKQPLENIDSTKDEEVSEAMEDEKTSGDEATAEKNRSKCAENTNDTPQSINKETKAQDSTTADSLEQAVATAMDVEAVTEDDAKEEGVAKENQIENDEKGQGPKSDEEDESSVSEPNKKTDETASPDNAEAMTASETMEIKAESSEEREALSCEEAPATDAEEAQQAESENRTAASGAEVTAETSSSSAEESRDTTVETAADKNLENINNAIGENAKDEESKDEAKEESETAADTDDSQGQMETGEQKTVIPVEIHEQKEQKSEAHHEDQGQQSHLNLEETAENENTLQGGNGEKQETEEGDYDNKADEEYLTEETENVMNINTREDKEAEETLNEHDPITKEEPGKAQDDQESECVENKDENKKSEALEAEEDNQDQDKNEKSAAVDINNDAEKYDRNDKESKMEQEALDNKNPESCEDKTDAADKTTVEMLELTEDTDKDNVKKSNENIQSDDVGGSDSAETAQSNEKPSDKTEKEYIEIEAEKASHSNEHGQIDAENGEISAGAESNAHLQEEDRQDLKAEAQQGQEEIKTEESTESQSSHVKKAPTRSEEGSEKLAEYEDDHASGGDMVETVESYNKEGDAENHDESIKDVSEPETLGTEIRSKPDNRKGNEGTEQHENSRKSNHDSENGESDLTEKNNNISEVNTVSSRAQEQSSAPVPVPLDNISHLLDLDNKESSEKFESKEEKLPHVDENVVSVDHSATEGENGADTEEASKASEEGASVLLKPDAQNNEAHDSGQGVTAIKGPAEALAVADNTDLVTNWVNMHQSSKYFETFVEPLEDLRKISDDQASTCNKEETLSIVHPKTETSPEAAKTLKEEEKGSELKAESESGDRTKVETVEADLESIHAEDKPCESHSANNTQQVEETAEVKNLIPISTTEQSDTESSNRQDTTSGAHKASRVSLEEDMVQDGPTEGDGEVNAFSKTEVESITATVQSVASHKAGSVSDNQPNEKTINNGPDFNLGQTATEEMKDPSLEDFHNSKSPDKLKDAAETWESGDVQSQEITEISELTASKLDDRSQEDSRGGDTDAKVSDENNGKDRNELIQDIKHTLSKDRLSTFLVDETMFGCSSYPLLTAARTESGH
ncbi:glutamate-rich protein 3 [Salarias fasciatus]|uniref:glutamate-rich protein 3 n=1 Tax=Salarias fasciatus TaxID=181472 RepID=UPI0011765110|nr:glutamate-rich protein 3 [Salarias fasciatus]